MDDKVKMLLSRIRGTAKGAAESATDAARAAGQMLDLAKLNVQIYDLNRERDEALLKLGQIMYNAHLGQMEDEETLSKLLDSTDRLTERIDELRDRVTALRHTKRCPHCGADCGQSDKFCRRCGKDL